MVAFDGGRRSLDRAGFDHIGVNGPLCQPPGILDLGRLGIEHVDERRPDGLAFLFRIGNPGQNLVKTLAGIYAHDVESHVLVLAQDALVFVLAQQAVVDKDAGEPIADGPREQHPGHRRVHASREPQHDLVLSEGLAQGCDGGLHERIGRPVLFQAGYPYQEIAQKLRAVLRVVHLGMELYAVGLLALDLVGSYRHIGRGSDDAETLGKLLDGVSVAHPHLEGVVEALEELDLHDIGPAVLAHLTGKHLSPRTVGEVLGTVAHPEQGNTSAKERKIHLRGIVLTHRRGTSAEDHRAES